MKTPGQKPGVFYGIMPRNAHSGIKLKNLYGVRTIIKILVLLHGMVGIDWQAAPKGSSLKTLKEAEEQGFILIRGEFQKRQISMTKLGSDYLDREKRRMAARHSDS